MKVKAKHNINLNGTYIKGGEVFEISTTDAYEIRDMIEIAETPILEPTTEEPIAEQPKRRGRPKKTD